MKKTVLSLVSAALLSFGTLAAQSPVVSSASPEFQAVYSNGKVILSWVGVPDVCSDRYVIERSKNGIDFAGVIEVEGPKTTCPYTEYFETDYQPLAGSSFYRLRQVSREGSIALSPSVPVNLAFDSQKGVFTFNNSDSDNSNLRLNLKGFENQEVLVSLLDMKGNVVLSKVQIVAEADHLIAIDTEGKLPPGDYIVTASSRNEVYSQKLTVK